MHNNKNPSEDFDLYDLLITIKNKIYKWRVLLIIALILGVTSGPIIYHFSSKTYLSRLLVTSNLLKGSAFIVVVDDLQRLIREENIDALKKLLNVSDTTARKIQELRVSSSQKFVERKLNVDIPEEVQYNDQVTNFIIEAYVSDNNILPELERGLLYYFKNNYYMKESGSRFKTELQEEIQKIDNELIDLDSVKKNLGIRNLPSNSKTSNIYISDPGKISDEVIKLYQLKMEDMDKIRKADVRIMENFIPNKKPFAPKLFFTVISWFFTFMILAVIIIALAELNEKLKERERNL